MRTIFVWIAPESSAWPTSATSTDALPTDLSGMEFICLASGIWLLA
jgi:hypothetical protein